VLACNGVRIIKTPVLSPMVGFVSDYRGMRIAKSGPRFWIERATVWNSLGHDGIRHGQAALIRGWSDA